MVPGTDETMDRSGHPRYGNLIATTLEGIMCAIVCGKASQNLHGGLTADYPGCGLASLRVSSE